MGTPVLQAFGIDLVDGWQALPKKMDDAAVASAEDALAASVAVSGRDINLILRHPKQKAAVVLRAAQALYQGTEMAASAALTKASALTSPNALDLLIKALKDLNATAALKDLERFLEQQTDVPEDEQAELLKVRIRNRLRLTPEDHRRFLGAIPDTLQEALDNLSPDRGATAQTDVLVDSLMKLRGETAQDRDTFRRRLMWGNAAHNYLKFLNHFKLPHDGPDENATRDTRKIIALSRQIKDYAARFDLQPLLAMKAAGRPIVMTFAHAGVHSLLAPAFKSLDLPTTIVTASETSGTLANGKMRVGTRRNVQTGFLKLVKTLRKEPRMVHIFPDGNRGVELREFDFLGRKIQLGQGAATLAFHSKAGTFFGGTTWENGRPRLYLKVGPVAEPGMERAEFDQAFYRFYLDCLKDIVLGPPEDIVGQGGIWRNLIMQSA